MEGVARNRARKISIGNRFSKGVIACFLQLTLTGICFFGYSYPLSKITYIFNSEIANKTILKLLVIASLYGKVGYIEITIYVLMLFLYDLATRFASNIVHKSFIMASINLASNIAIKAVTDEATVYNILVILFESIIIFAASIVFDRILKVLFGKVQKNRINDEEVISLLILSTLVLTGLGTISILPVNLMYVFGYVFILLCCLSGGVLYGAMAGSVVAASILIAGNSFSEYYLLLPIISMIAGIFKGIGKTAVYLVFSILAIFLYFTSSIFMIDGIEFLKNLGIAVIISYMIPISVNKKIERMFKINSVNLKKDDIKKVKTEISFMLEKFSESFMKLAGTYDEAVLVNKSITKIETDKTIEQTIKRVCKSCTCYEKCWQNNYYNTNKNMYEIMSNIENNKVLDELSFENESWCTNSKSLIYNIADIMELQRNNLYLSTKIQKNKKLLADQLYEIAGMTQSMAKNIECDKEIVEEIEEKIIQALEEVDSPILEAVVLKKENKYTIELVFGKEIVNIERPVRIVENVIDKMFKVVSVNRDIDLTKVVLAEKENYNVEFGCVKHCKNFDNICGDNYKQIDMDDGSYVIGLADGMGSGASADIESKLTLELIEKFIKMGFSKKFIVKSINSMMTINTQKELYSTLDLLIIDRDMGRLELIKVGAFPTFIKSREGIEIIDSDSMPIGLVDEVDVNIVEKDLYDGDIIVTMTDGMVNKNQMLGEIKMFISEILENIYNNNSHEIAEYIMNGIKTKYNNEICDDLTIIVSRIIKS